MQLVLKSLIHYQSADIGIIFERVVNIQLNQIYIFFKRYFLFPLEEMCSITAI